MHDTDRSDDLNQLSRYLSTDVFGRQCRYLAVVDSTNDEAARWARSGEAPHGGVVMAEQQSAGRGRLGRSWSSPSQGDLYVSVICRPTSVLHGVGALGLVVALALRCAIQRTLEPKKVQVDLKWPNDLLIDSRKLGGILCECRWIDGLPELVIGFGINVQRTEFEPGLLYAGAGTFAVRPTSLAIALPETKLPGRAILLAEILYDLERYLERYFSGGFAQLRREYEGACLTLGKRVRLGSSTPGESADFASSHDSRGLNAIHEPEKLRKSTEYIAETLEEDGALRVRSLETGACFRVESADVWLANR